MAAFTTIRIRKSTAEKLKKLGKKGETYEDIILRLLKKSGDSGHDTPVT